MPKNNEITQSVTDYDTQLDFTTDILYIQITGIQEQLLVFFLKLSYLSITAFKKTTIKY